MASSRFNVSTVFSALDRMTAPLRNMSAGIRGFTSQIQNANSRIHGFGNNPAIGRLNVRIQALRRNITGLAGDIGHAAGKLAKMAMPGMGTLAVGAAATYGVAKLIQNSAEYEGIDTTTKGLLYGSPDFKKSMSRAQMDEEAKHQGILAENAGNVSVGQYRDYANMGNVNLARGILPTERLMQAFGALSASMPGEDKAGQFLDTMKSMMRGEMATADNIPGVKGHIDKKTHEAYMKKDGVTYHLGSPDGKNYAQNLNQAYTSIAEKYFKELGEMQGATFEAKWSTMVSAITRGLDDMLRKTEWWEKSIKPATEFLTGVFKAMTPKLMIFSQTLYEKFSQLGSKGGDLITGTLNKLLDWMIKITASLDQTKIDAFGAWLDSLPTKFENGFIAFNKFADVTLPKIVTGLEALAEITSRIITFLDYLPGLGRDIGGNVYDYTHPTTENKFGAKWNSSSPANISSIDPTRTSSSGSANGEVAVKVDINSTTGQTITSATTSGNGLKKPVVNTGNNSNRAQPMKGASLFGGY